MGLIARMHVLEAQGGNNSIGRYRAFVSASKLFMASYLAKQLLCIGATLRCPLWPCKSGCGFHQHHGPDQSEIASSSPASLPAAAGLYVMRG